MGDVDPHCSGLCACEADGSTIVVEVRASTLFEGRGGWAAELLEGRGNGSRMPRRVKYFSV